MNEPTIKLPEEAWQRVLQILATAPWQAANPLIMAIGEQLRQQTVERPDGAERPQPFRQ